MTLGDEEFSKKQIYKYGILSEYSLIEVTLVKQATGISKKLMKKLSDIS